MHVNRILIFIGALVNGALALNILAVFPYQGKSHFFVFQPYLRELARRGHNMTVISCFPEDNPLENYHDISLAGKTEILENVYPLKPSYWSTIQISLFLIDFGTQNCKTLLADESVQNLWKSKTKFDLVLVEQFNSDCSLGLAYKLGAPVVGLTTTMLWPWSYARLGIQYNPSHISLQFLEGGTKPTLYQRVERTIFNTYFTTLYKYVGQREDQNTLAHYFDDVPPLEELGRDIKFILLYTHFLHSGSRLLPANVIEVGGYHVAKPKELPEDIKNFIDQSEHGVIYISFGSMLRTASMPKDILVTIIEAVSELPQRVIWKWEEKSLPGDPKNIYLSNWLPQNDILAHPKVLAFYSHCGLLGITEAIYHGIPIIGMPFFADQPTNAAAVEESGLGVQILTRELTKDKLLEKFKIVLNPEFRTRVKQISKAWHDRPTSAMDSAIFWTEYAARNANFTFRNAAAGVPYYQYAGLDVLAVLAIVPLVLILVFKSLVSLFNKKPSVSIQTKTKSKSKKLN